ncbi:MAG: 1-deoxy-D-xylulose-5-phosphate reductoisomerase, partial [Oscillospiraceae bacterium]|jgi:1-deoxy-D-xylulose-5-phosphate reductoisomerase|nr:1-deoxy-D-xylulose-5-phosphate reductoisomerase [Oscillospiraceae bacterium]
LILTASGGAFFGKSKEALAEVTVREALKHPNWHMGAKITVDSATLMNKGLEVLEAAWLFGLPPQKIDVVVHRQSVVHSMVEYDDGAVLAQLGTPDMRLPIQYALTYPERQPSPAPSLDLLRCGPLTFEPTDNDAFPAIDLCRRAFAMGDLAPALLNGANEAANQLFREGKIAFHQITEVVARVLEALPNASGGVSLRSILAADHAARACVHQLLQLKFPARKD